MKLASSVTLSASTPRCSTTIFFTRSAVSLMLKLPPFCFCAALAMRLLTCKWRGQPRGVRCSRDGTPFPHDWRSRAGAIDLRRCDRLFEGAADQGKMVALPSAKRRNGADGQHLVSSGRRRLVGGFREGAIEAARLLHP